MNEIMTYNSMNLPGFNLSDIINDFDTSCVKVEPEDFSLFDDAVFDKNSDRTYQNLDNTNTWTSDTKSDIDSYIDQTYVDFPSSIGVDTQSSITDSKTRGKRKNSRSNMTDVLQNPGAVAPTPTRKRGEGKKAGRGSNTPYTTVPLPPCKVCGGVATGFHFGVITCEACKAFFRRALIHKQAYKCLKDDNCEIIDKKLGNCSACRLKKCFLLGMSKGGVRRGRYSIAIRTKAIVEAKAMEGKALDPMLPSKRPRISSPSSDTMSLSPDARTIDSGFDDAFDGLLEISDMDENMNMTVTMLPYPNVTAQTVPSVPVNSELEFLIDALLSCQDAVYPKLRQQYENYKQEMQVKFFENLVIKEELFDEMFGRTDVLSTEEYQTVFAETGLDIDDRLTHFNKKGKSMEESIAQYVNFAKIIPGFKSLNPKDVSKLLKASHLEFWIFGTHKLFNKQLGVCTAWDGSDGTTKDMMRKFFDIEWIERAMNFAESLQKLNLSYTEMALIRVILLTYTDRCAIVDREKIQALQVKFVECLQYHLARTVANPGQRIAKIFDRLLAIRDLSAFNIEINKKFLMEWGFLMHDYPLWKEMLSFDEI